MAILLRRDDKTVGVLDGRKLALLDGEDALLRLWETGRAPAFRSVPGAKGGRVVDGVSSLRPGSPGFEEAFGGMCETHDVAYWVPAGPEDAPAFRALPGVTVHEPA